MKKNKYKRRVEHFARRFIATAINRTPYAPFGGYEKNEVLEIEPGYKCKITQVYRNIPESIQKRIEKLVSPYCYYISELEDISLNYTSFKDIYE